MAIIAFPQKCVLDALDKKKFHFILSNPPLPSIDRQFFLEKKYCDFTLQLKIKDTSCVMIDYFVADYCSIEILSLYSSDNGIYRNIFCFRLLKYKMRPFSMLDFTEFKIVIFEKKEILADSRFILL